MAVLNPNVESVMIDGALFKDEVEARQIMAVPMVFVNGEHFGQGRMTVEEIVAKVSRGGTPILEPKEPFDVLVVGGGPAGSAAAVYAARKGIRTGVVVSDDGSREEGRPAKYLLLDPAQLRIDS
jgi:alkyl hydroperoxide reductase subunit F